MAGKKSKLGDNPEEEGRGRCADKRTFQITTVLRLNAVYFERGARKSIGGARPNSSLKNLKRGEEILVDAHLDREVNNVARKDPIQEEEWDVGHWS